MYLYLDVNDVIVESELLTIKEYLNQMTNVTLRGHYSRGWLKEMNSRISAFCSVDVKSSTKPIYKFEKTVDRLY